MLLKLLLIGLLLVVMFNLFHALYYMVKNNDQAPKMSKFLGRRLIFSALLILFVVLALVTGLILPNPTPH